MFQKLSAMHRSNILILILAAFLPVAVLVVGSMIFPARAGLVAGESARPNASGNYYRAPGQDSLYFGPEIYSDTLCGGRFNRGFDISRTRENASVRASSTAGAVHWHRTQRWDFRTDRHRTPWGGNYSLITIRDHLGWSEISSGGGTTGFPWSGYEEHWRDIDDENIIRSEAEITGYRRIDWNRNRWVCPKYFKQTGTTDGITTVGGTWNYSCRNENTWGPVFTEQVRIIKRANQDPYGIGQTTRKRYDCIRLN